MSEIIQPSALRAVLSEALITLLNGAKPTEDVVQQIEQIQQYILSSEGVFSLGSIVYGGVVRLLLDKGIQSDPAALSSLLAEITGDKPTWFIFVFKHNFTGLISQRQMSILKMAEDTIQLLRKITIDEKNDHTMDMVKCEELLDSLSDFLVNQGPIESLPDLLLSRIANCVVSIPYKEGSFFDPTEHYNSIYPKPMQVPIRSQMEYAFHLIQQVRGEEVLFLDITILKDGYVLSPR